jgi:hypothetical protein
MRGEPSSWLRRSTAWARNLILERTKAGLNTARARRQREGRLKRLDVDQRVVAVAPFERWRHTVNENRLAAGCAPTSVRSEREPGRGGRLGRSEAWSKGGRSIWRKAVAGGPLPRSGLVQRPLSITKIGRGRGAHHPDKRSYSTFINRRAKRFQDGPGHPRSARRQHLGQVYKGADRDDRGLAAARPVTVPHIADSRRFRGSGPVPPPSCPRRSRR